MLLLTNIWSIDIYFVTKLVAKSGTS